MRDFRPEWTGFVNMHLQWSRHSLVARNSANKLYLVSGGVCPRSGPRVAKGKCPEADWHEQNIFMEVAPRYGCAASVTVHGCAAQAAHLLLARFCRARASTWPHARKGFDICPVSRAAAWATRHRMGLAQPHGHAPQATPEERAAAWPRAASKARRTRSRMATRRKQRPKNASSCSLRPFPGASSGASLKAISGCIRRNCGQKIRAFSL